MVEVGRVIDARGPQTCRPVGWACGCSPATGRRSTPPIAAGRLVFGIFAVLAEFERELIRERTVAGLSRPRGPADARAAR